MAKKIKDFSILRVPTPLITRTISIAVVSDALLILTLLLLVAIRDTLGVDSTLAGLSILIFALKTMIMVFGLFTVLNDWLKTSYFVSNGQLVIYSTSAAKDSNVYNLSEVRSMKLDKGRLGSKFNHGNITLKFAQGSYKENVTLTDVSSPEQVMANLKP